MVNGNGQNYLGMLDQIIQGATPLIGDNFDQMYNRQRAQDVIAQAQRLINNLCATYNLMPPGAQYNPAPGTQVAPVQAQPQPIDAGVQAPQWNALPLAGGYAPQAMPQWNVQQPFVPLDGGYAFNPFLQQPTQAQPLYDNMDWRGTYQGRPAILDVRDRVRPARIWNSPRFYSEQIERLEDHLFTGGRTTDPVITRLAEEAGRVRGVRADIIGPNQIMIYDNHRYHTFDRSTVGHINVTVENGVNNELILKVKSRGRDGRSEVNYIPYEQLQSKVDTFWSPQRDIFSYVARQSMMRLPTWIDASRWRRSHNRRISARTDRAILSNYFSLTDQWRPAENPECGDVAPGLQPRLVPPQRLAGRTRAPQWQQLPAGGFQVNPYQQPMIGPQPIRYTQPQPHQQPGSVRPPQVAQPQAGPVNPPAQPGVQGGARPNAQTQPGQRAPPQQPGAGQGGVAGTPAQQTYVPRGGRIR